MSTYGWIITRDHLVEAEEKDTPNPEDRIFTSSVGTMGPLDITDATTQRLKDGKGKVFKLYDDDGELYYSGRFWVDDMIDPNPPKLIAGLEQYLPYDDVYMQPLFDFGTPNAGATEIRYKHPTTGEWRTL